MFSSVSAFSTVTMLSSSTRVKDSHVELSKVEDLHRVILVVFGVEVRGLEALLPTLFVLVAIGDMLVDEVCMQEVNVLEQISWKGSCSHHHRTPSVGHISE